MEILYHYFEFHKILGDIFLEKGYFNESVHHFLQFLKIKPDSEKVHNNLGIAYYKKGNAELAAHHFFKALEKVDKAAIQIGSLLIVKQTIGGGNSLICVRTLTQQELRTLQNSPNILQSPLLE